MSATTKRELVLLYSKTVSPSRPTDKKGKGGAGKKIKETSPTTGRNTMTMWNQQQKRVVVTYQMESDKLQNRGQSGCWSWGEECKRGHIEYATRINRVDITRHLYDIIT